MSEYELLLREVRACTLCEAHLPLGARPVFQFHPKAKILIAGQAPGRKVHASGMPFDDASGDRLREWMGISKTVFYKPERIAILPMGFCYPGSGKSGDLPPRPECEPAWRARLLGQLTQIEMTLVLGKHAHISHFGKAVTSVTELVASWRDYWPDTVPLPHPSPRNNIWLRRNPWFEEELLMPVRSRIAEILDQPPGNKKR